MRIVSLSASATAIVRALGLEDELVGLSDDLWADEDGVAAIVTGLERWIHEEDDSGLTMYVAGEETGE